MLPPQPHPRKHHLSPFLISPPILFAPSPPPGESGFNILNEHFANPELEQVFAVPTYAKAIFEGLPMTQALTGVQDLFDKAENFLPEDVSTIISLSGGLGYSLDYGIHGPLVL